MSRMYNEMNFDNKILRATYEQVLHFKIPEGLDLDDTDMVKTYFVKWGVLHINLNGTFKYNEQDWLRIEGHSQEVDYKRPENVSIQNADEYGCEYMFERKDMNDEIVENLRRQIAIKKGVIVLDDDDDEPTPVQKITIEEPSEIEIVADCLDFIMERLEDEETNKIKENECPVCLEQFGTGMMQPAVGENCNHKICFTDFNTIVNDTNVCPICREILIEYEEEEYSDSEDGLDEPVAVELVDGDAIAERPSGLPNSPILLMVRFEGEWVDYETINADDDLNRQFIQARIANCLQVDRYIGYHNVCRYCGIQENSFALSCFENLRENYYGFDDLDICRIHILDDINNHQVINGDMYYDDGACPLCRFIDENTCDNCNNFQMGLDENCIICGDEEETESDEN